jgi:hypothetical protein
LTRKFVVLPFGSEYCSPGYTPMSQIFVCKSWGFWECLAYKGV